MTNIALFGTSADPPTVGHQKILLWLADRFDLVAVWAADNPLKTGQTPLKHRLAMLSLLIDELARSHHNLSFHPELSHPRTIETVRRSQKIWPHGSFTLAIGSDLVSQLSQWYRADDLFKQVDILVVPRPGFPLDRTELERIRQRGTLVSIAHNAQVPAVSSSEYRMTGNSDQLTPPIIEAYIQHQQLYHDQNISANNASTR